MDRVTGKGKNYFLNKKLSSISPHQSIEISRDIYGSNEPMLHRLDESIDNITFYQFPLSTNCFMIPYHIIPEIEWKHIR